VHNVGFEHSPAFTEERLAKTLACGQVRRGQRLEGVGVSNGNEISPADLWYYRDVGTEIKVDGQRNKFIKGEEMISFYEWHMQYQNDSLFLWPMNKRNIKIVQISWFMDKFVIICFCLQYHQCG
jgi:hypothetical protein